MPKNAHVAEHNDYITNQDCPQIYATSSPVIVRNTLHQRADTDLKESSKTGNKSLRNGNNNMTAASYTPSLGYYYDQHGNPSIPQHLLQGSATMGIEHPQDSVQFTNGGKS